MYKHAHKLRRISTTTLVVAFVFVVMAVASLTAYVSAQHSFRNAVRLAVTHQPETFTELYFLNPSTLPAYSAPGEKQTVQFHIQNELSVTKKYTYQVSATLGSKTSVKSVTVPIPAGQGITVAYAFVIPNPNEPITISVKLKGTQEWLLLRSHS